MAETKKYWLNTYFPYYRWKSVCDSKEFALFSLKQIILLSTDFWSCKPDLCEEYFKRPFGISWWMDRYVQDPNFTGFTLLCLDISPRRQEKWFKSSGQALPPVDIQENENDL